MLAAAIDMVGGEDICGIGVDIGAGECAGRAERCAGVQHGARPGDRVAVFAAKLISPAVNACARGGTHLRRASRLSRPLNIVYFDTASSSARAWSIWSYA